MAIDPVGGLIGGVNKVVGKVSETPPGRALNGLAARVPKPPEVRLPTPFGHIITPDLSLPHLRAIPFDERHRAAFKATAAMDLADIIAIVPVAGDAIADFVRDTYEATLYENMSADEQARFRRYNKIPLHTVAMARTFMLER